MDYETISKKLGVQVKTVDGIVAKYTIWNMTINPPTGLRPQTRSDLVGFSWLNRSRSTHRRQLMISQSPRKPLLALYDPMVHDLDELSLVGWEQKSMPKSSTLASTQPVVFGVRKRLPMTSRTPSQRSSMEVEALCFVLFFCTKLLQRWEGGRSHVIKSCVKTSFLLSIKRLKVGHGWVI